MVSKPCDIRIENKITADHVDSRLNLKHTVPQVRMQILVPINHPNEEL
jgi:hypothetical protein